MLTLTPPDIARMNRGILVERAAAVLPATTTTAYFTVTGFVELVDFYGVCTTVCSGTATRLSAIHVPTSGTNADICTDSGSTGLAITSFAAGSLVVAELDGTPFVGTTAVSARSTVGFNRMILGAGSISLVTSATNTGAFRWVVRYVPLESGSTIVSA